MIKVTWLNPRQNTWDWRRRARSGSQWCRIPGRSSTFKAMNSPWPFCKSTATTARRLFSRRATSRAMCVSAWKWVSTASSLISAVTLSASPASAAISKCKSETAMCNRSSALRTSVMLAPCPHKYVFGWSEIITINCFSKGSAGFKWRNVCQVRRSPPDRHFRHNDGHYLLPS